MQFTGVIHRWRDGWGRGNIIYLLYQAPYAGWGYCPISNIKQLIALHAPLHLSDGLRVWHR